MAAILVVDDSAVTRRLLSSVLTNHGHTVMMALNGRHAVARLSEVKFDIVISDLAMPEMNGIELLKYMRSEEDFRDLPVIMLTASGMDQDRTLARVEGVNGFLTKPFSSWELIEMVNQALGLENGLELTQDASA